MKLYKFLKEELKEDDDNEQIINHYQSVIDNIYDELVSGNLLIIPTEELSIDIIKNTSPYLKIISIISKKTKNLFSASLGDIDIDAYVKLIYNSKINSLIIKISFDLADTEWQRAIIQYEYDFNKEFEENLNDLKRDLEIKTQKFRKYMDEIEANKRTTDQFIY